MKWIRRLFKFDKSPKAQAIDIPVETKQVDNTNNENFFI